MFLDYQGNKLSMTVLFIANVVLLVILLIGLFRLLRSGDVFSLWRVLWKQVGTSGGSRCLGVLYPDSFLRSLGRLLPICCYGRRATSSGKSSWNFAHTILLIPIPI